jgi:hypothetical protein
MERTSFIAYPIRAQGFHLETPSFSPAPLCKSLDILALRKRRGFPDGDQCPDREALDASLPDALWQSKPPSRRYPHLRYLVLIGDVPVGQLAVRTADTVKPTDSGAILFSSGSTATPKGIINSQRGIAIHLWRWRRLSALSPRLPG